MSAIHQGICSNCGYETAPMAGECGAVLVTPPVKSEEKVAVGRLLASEILGDRATVQDDQLIVLGHPLETSILAGTGYTWHELLRQGRYVRITEVICRQCGNIFAKRQLAVPGGVGCRVISLNLIAGIVSGIGIGSWTHSLLLAIVTFIGAAWCLETGCETFAHRHLQRRFHERAIVFASDALCPVCNADDSVSFTSAKRNRCPACREESLNVKMVGIS
jgi:hypothetical protein